MRTIAQAVAILSIAFAATAAPGGKPGANTHECFYKESNDGCTLSTTSTVDIFGCESEGYYFNVHRVLLQAAFTYTFTLTSVGSNYSPFIGISHEDSNVYFVQKTGSRGGSVVVTYKPPTDDYYEVFVGAAERAVTGSFRLTASCKFGGSEPQPTCTSSATDVCLLSNRFRVSVTYRNQFANPPQNGTFLGAKLIAGVQNPDVATFGISSPQAIEVVVRLQDARPFGVNRFDVYYGGLTDLEYTVTVWDIVTGTMRTYRNPPGTVGGGVDRTSFPAN